MKVFLTKREKRLYIFIFILEFLKDFFDDMKVTRDKLDKLIRKELYNSLFTEDVETDEYYRGLAEDFFDKLQDYFEENIGEISDLGSSDDANERMIHPREMGTQDKFENLFVYLVKWSKQPKMKNMVANWYLYLPILYDSDTDEDFLLKRLRDRKGVIIHELIHYLDYKERGVDIGKAPSATGEKREIYFNSPSEFNAYYQEGITNIQKFLDFAGLDYLDGRHLESFEDFKHWVLERRKFFNENFIGNLTEDNYRRLVKRLYKWFVEKIKE